MDRVFWLSIVLGGAVGLVASIIGNLCTPLVSAYWHKHKAARLEETKKKAFTKYEQLAGLHDGREDKFIYFIGISMRFTLCMVLGAFFGLVGIQVSLAERSAGAVEQVATIFSQGVLMGASTYFFVRAIMALIHYREWRWRLDNFEQYKDELRIRYGALPTEHHSPSIASA